MKMNIAYAALVGTTLLGAPALAQQSGGAGQAPAGQFIDKQAADEWRAPKLVGVDVYGADNKKIGTVKDILMNHDGSVQAVVIGVGGFLGIGAKEVAVPFHSVKWQTESRALPSQSSTPSGGAPLAPSGDKLGNTPPPQPPPKMTNPAESEASQGYPDKAVIDMTMAQLKSAPAFQYAQTPPATSGSASQNAAAPRPQPQPSKP